MGDFVRVRTGKTVDFWDTTILDIVTDNMIIRYEDIIEHINVPLVSVSHRDTPWS